MSEPRRPRPPRSSRSTVSFGYATPGLRVGFPIFFAIMLVVAVYFTGFVLTSSDEQFVARGGESNRSAVAIFLVLWVAAVLYGAYEWLWKIGTKVVVTTHELTWSSLLQSRTVPLSEVVGNDASSHRHDVLLLRDETGLPVLATDDGWLTFVSELAAKAPHARFVIARSTRFRNGFASRNRSGFRTH